MNLEAEPYTRYLAHPGVFCQSPGVFWGVQGRKREREREGEGERKRKRVDLLFRAIVERAFFKNLLSHSFISLK